MTKQIGTTSEQILVAALKRGEERAFTEVMDLYKTQIVNTVFGMLGSVAEVDDVGQEVFVRFFKNIANFKGEAKISTYLTRIAINLSLNALKKRKRNWRLLYSADYSEYTMQNCYHQEEVELDDRTVLLRSSILILDEKYKQVVVLRVFQDLSFKEISEVLELPIGTVLTRFSRAQKKLIALMNK
jgi:RNA polymerase sigma-70 factor (ECF subfamily)